MGRYMLSGRGTDFGTGVASLLAKNLGADKRRTRLYNPHPDGCCERTAGTIANEQAKKMRELKAGREGKLPAASMAMPETSQLLTPPLALLAAAISLPGSGWNWAGRQISIKISGDGSPRWGALKGGLIRRTRTCATPGNF